MKKLFLFTTVVFLAIASSAQVSRKTAPNQKVYSDSMSAHNKVMMDELNLTADQKSQMKTIQENTKQQREAIKNDASLTQDEKRAKMKDLQKSHSQKVNSILTPDQQAKRSAYIQKMKANGKMHGKQSGFHHDRKGNMMTNLNLTPDQKTQMKALSESNKQQRDAIKNDVSLTQDQKKAKMKDLYKSQSEKMDSILTPEQQATRKANMEKMKSERKMHLKNSSGTNTPAPPVQQNQ